jgi:hypothetical protein
MIAGNYLLTIFLSFAVLLNFEDCATNAKTKGTMKMNAGNYSGALPKTPGFIKLEIKDGGGVTLLNVVTIHLPPVEIERLETKLSQSKDNSAPCFETKPKTVEPCLVSANEQEIVVKLIPDGTEVKLKRIQK